MVLNAVLLVALGLFCLVAAIIAVIFTIIGFANNKPHKYTWLTFFFIFLIGLIATVMLIVRKVVHAAKGFSEKATEQFENFSDSMEHLSDSLQHGQEYNYKNSPQIKILKTYSKDTLNTPAQFYYYLGFGPYHRLPLPYPYSIHCTNFVTDGELFNEKNVSRFDENDNGEISTNITFITRISFDKNFLLLEQNVRSDRSEKVVQHFILFSFDTEKKEEFSSEKELVKAAKVKGYMGSDSLISIEEYDRLF